MRETWRRDLAVLALELSLDAGDVRAVLDGWVRQRDRLRESKRLDAAVRARQFPALREVWWSRHRDWLLVQLEGVRGATEERPTSTTLGPAELPETEEPGEGASWLRRGAG
jgi:hypothetical protein